MFQQIINELERKEIDSTQAVLDEKIKKLIAIRDSLDKRIEEICFENIREFKIKDILQEEDLEMCVVDVIKVEEGGN